MEDPNVYSSNVNTVTLPGILHVRIPLAWKWSVASLQITWWLTKTFSCKTTLPYTPIQNRNETNWWTDQLQKITWLHKT